MLLGALVLAPAAAALETTHLSGELLGAIGIAAPPSIGFGSVALTGTRLTEPASVGAWSFEDQGGTAGLVVQVSDTGVKAVGGAGLQGFKEELISPAVLPTDEAADEELTAGKRPIRAEAATVVEHSPKTLYHQSGSVGHGSWEVPAGGPGSITMSIPANAPAVAYEDTLEFTIGPEAG